MPCDYAPVPNCDCHDCQKRGYECSNCIAYGQWTPDDWLMVPCLNCINSLNRVNCYPVHIVGVPNRILSEPEKECWKQFWEQSEATARRYGATFGNDEPVRETNTPTFTADMFSTPTRPIRNNRVVQPISFETTDDEDIFSEESDEEDNECQSFISLQCEHCGRLGAAHTHRIAEIQGWTTRDDEQWYCHYQECQEVFNNNWDIYTCHRCNRVERFSDHQHMLDSEWNTSLCDGDLLCDECAVRVEEEQNREYNCDDSADECDSDASTVIAGPNDDSDNSRIILCCWNCTRVEYADDLEDASGMGWDFICRDSENGEGVWYCPLRRCQLMRE